MNPIIEQQLRAIAGSLDKLPDDERFVEGEELIEALRQVISQVGAVRAAALRELRKHSTLQELGDRFGKSPQRISQILDR